MQSLRDVQRFFVILQPAAPAPNKDGAAGGSGEQPAAVKQPDEPEGGNAPPGDAKGSTDDAHPSPVEGGEREGVETGGTPQVEEPKLEGVQSAAAQCRLILIGKKRLPDPVKHERLFAFVRWIGEGRGLC